MSGITRRDIEKVYSKIGEELEYMDSQERFHILRQIEKKANSYNGDVVSDEKALQISYEKLKYNVARIYGEGKALSTLVGITKYLEAIDDTLNYICNLQKNEKEVMMLKDLITYLEISLRLDVSFHTSLENIYRDCMQKERVYFNDIQNKYKGVKLI